MCLKFLSDRLKCDSNPALFCRLADVHFYWQKNVDRLAGTFPGCIPGSHLMRPRPGSKVNGYKYI